MERSGAQNGVSQKQILGKNKEAKKKSEKRPIALKRGPSKTTSAALMSLINRHKKAGLQGKAFSSVLKKDIPYLLPEFGKGTQYLAIRLYGGPFNLSTTSSTAFNTVQPIDANIFTDFSNLASVFDEYRVVQGHVWYTPTTILTSESLALETGYTIACIDYADNTALGSAAAVLTHDTHREFYLVGIHSQQLSKKQCRGVASWPVVFEKLPDQFWTSTETADVEFAYWKPYMEGTHSPGSLEVGHLMLWMDFQFRGLRE